MPEVSNPFKYPHTQNIIPGQTAAVNIKMPETVPNLPLSPSPSRPVSPASKQEAAEILAKPGGLSGAFGKNQNIRPPYAHSLSSVNPPKENEKNREAARRFPVFSTSVLFVSRPAPADIPGPGAGDRKSVV